MKILVSYLGAVAFAVLSLLLVFPPDYFFFSNLQAFALPFAVIYFLIAFCIFLFRKVRIYKLIFISCLLGSVLISSLFIPYLLVYHYVTAKNEDNNFSVGNFNIWYENPKKLATIEKILEANVDLLGLEEISTVWNTLLQQHLAKKYPYHFSIPIDDSYFGIAVFSKYPFKKIAQHDWAGYAGIAGVVSAPFGEVAFAVTHFAVPKESYRYEIRKLQFLEVADYLNKHQDYKIALGDFNTVSWSMEVTQFQHNANLKDSRKGIAPTFPASLPMIPLDYVFYSPNFQCIDFETIKTHSDHLGIVARFSSSKR